MTPTVEEIETLIITTVRELAEDFALEGLATVTADTRLYGAKSALDSISLVSLIAELESRLAERYGAQIILADERAMDQRLTPFARVSTLTTYIMSHFEKEETP